MTTALASLLCCVSGALQTWSLGDFCKRISRTRSVVGVSHDFVLYSCIHSFASVIYGVSLTTTTCAHLHAERFPVYPKFTISSLVSLSDFSIFVVSSYLVYLVFAKYRPSRTSTEDPSLIFFLLNGLLLACFCYLLTLYIRGKATINTLDMADFFWLVADIAGSVRFISQISTNWFYCRYYHISRDFLTLQTTSVLLYIGAYLVLRVLHVPWHRYPLNMATSEFVFFNSICLVTLAIQKRIYRRFELPLYYLLPPTSYESNLTCI